MTPVGDGLGQAAVAGIGTVGFARSIEESVAKLADRALDLALEDAGLGRVDVDALFTDNPDKFPRK